MGLCYAIRVVLSDIGTLLRYFTPWAFYRIFICPYSNTPVYALRTLLFACVDLPLLLTSLISFSDDEAILLTLSITGSVILLATLYIVLIHFPKTLKVYAEMRNQGLPNQTVGIGFRPQMGLSTPRNMVTHNLTQKSQTASRVTELWKRIDKSSKNGKMATAIDILVFLADQANFYIGIYMYDLEGFDPLSFMLTMLSLFDMIAYGCSIVQNVYIYCLGIKEGTQFKISMCACALVCFPGPALALGLYGLSTYIYGSQFFLSLTGEVEDSTSDSSQSQDLLAAIGFFLISFALLFSSLCGCIFIILPQILCCPKKTRGEIIYVS